MANEERLIDANAWLEWLWERVCRGGAISIKDIHESIMDAPTVAAKKVAHGRWISSGCGFDCCSECRKVYADGYLTAMGIKPRTQFNYCPNCGAKMDGDGNG